MKTVYSSETFYFYLIKDVLEMIDLSKFLTEGKEEQFFNSVKSIIEKDPACAKVMSRTDVYDENKRGSAKMPRILIKENDGYEWYTLDIVDKELDIAAPKDIIGIFINRMFYPLNDKKLLMSIIDKYSSQNNYVV